MKRILPILLVMLLGAREVRAWGSASEVVHGSARILEKGETIIGVLSPLAFGLHEQVTIFLHPALYLFLTPNIWGRAAVLEGPLGVSVEAGYQQSFLVLSQATTDGKAHYPGFMQFGAVASMALSNSLQLNAAAGYVLELVTAGGRTGVSGAYGRLGADYLLAANHLLMGEVRTRYLNGEGFAVPTATVIYARQLGRMRVGGGLCFGQFELANGATRLPSGATDPVADTWSIPVYPWVDVWWRF